MEEYRYEITPSVITNGYNASVIKADKVIVRFLNCPTKEKAEERAKWYISKL